MVPFHDRHRASALQAPHERRLEPADRKKMDQIALTSISIRPGRSLQGVTSGGREEGWQEEWVGWGK
jgi:hypothetical protein